jgi:hypothetical protein
MPQCMLCEADHGRKTTARNMRAIGGRWRVSGFICRACNSATGETWAAELAQQLLPFSLMLDISRKRGQTPPLKVTTTAGQGQRLHPILLPRKGKGWSIFFGVGLGSKSAGAKEDPRGEQESAS